MDAQSLLLRYRERLAWSADETLTVLETFVDANDLVEPLKEFLVDETGVALTPDDDLFGYRGKPFAVFAFGPKSDRRSPDERIDTESEVLALEAFSKLLGRPDLQHFVVIQFRARTDSSRELLRYDRRTSDSEW